LAKQTILKFGPYDRIVRQILEIASVGVSKKKIMERFSLSGVQLRRLIAELQGKDLLRYHHTLGLFITSAKGNIFLKRTDNIDSVILKAKDIARRMIMLDSGKTLLDARNTMLRYNISRIVISINGKAFGIVTENDVARLLYETSPTKRLNEIRLKDLIHKKLVTIDENSMINDCSKLMLKNNISSLVVTGNGGKDKGIITKTDLVELYAYHQSTSWKVREYMQTKVQTVFPDETIHMIAVLMDTYDISRVVVKQNKKPVGIVTTRDFLPISLSRNTTLFERSWKSPRKSIKIRRHQKFMPRGLMAFVLAEDIMSHPPITVGMDTDLSDAATLMIRNKISGLPVVSGRGNLVGIITKTDILKSKFAFIYRLLLSLEDY
jgi:CBS domain-containing protein